jgi:uncharacterized membrane protein
MRFPIPSVAIHALAGVAILFLGSQAVTAQTGQQPAASLATEELRAFAAASLEVESVSREANETIVDAETDMEREQLRAQAVEDMRQAVLDEGLTLNRYNQIYEASQANAQVAEQIRSYRDELR